MKKKLLNIVAFSIIALSISSCSTPGTSSSISEVLSSSSSSSSSSNSNVSSSETQSSSLSSYDLDKEYEQTYFDQYIHHNTKNRIPATGRSKMLVVPVVFTDFMYDITDEEITTIYSDLEAAFFGDETNTSWESVSSFYNKSSHGRVKIEGEVADIYYTNKSLTTYATTAYQQGTTVASDEILMEVYNYYFKEPGNLYNVDDYDSDKDGVIDSIYMVYYYPQGGYKSSYSYPSYLTNTIMDSTGWGSAFAWAYTYWDVDNTSSKAHEQLGVYSWSSYFYTKNKSSSKPDAHTYIHETGHIFGLEDYYSNDNSNGYTSPSGSNTMMDFNVTDLDSASKYLLGWTNPTIIDDKNNNKTKTYNLSNFQETGDVLVITDNWNGSVFDDVLILEYYTPTGLNKNDCDSTYINGCPGNSGTGIRIYHLDSRLAEIYYNSATNSFKSKGFVEHPDLSNIATDDCRYYVGASNTLSRSYTNNLLLQMLEGQGSEVFITPSSTFTSNFISNQEDLFTTGADFNQLFPSFKLHNGNSLPCNIEIGNLGETAEITVTF